MQGLCHDMHHGSPNKKGEKEWQGSLDFPGRARAKRMQGRGCGMRLQQREAEEEGGGVPWVRPFRR